MGHRLRRFRAAAAVALLAAASAAQGATIIVNSLADDVVVNGNCSLREAVQAANTNAAVDGCTAGTPGSDTIVLPAGTLPLASSLQIAESLVVTGAGRGTTVVQRGTSTAFNSSAPAPSLLELRDLSMVGALNTSDAALVVTRVDFLAGSGGVNTSTGPITLTDVTMVNAGVNSSSGTVSLVNTTITFGAGTAVNSLSSPITLTDSTINGGGLNSSTGSITLTRSAMVGASSTAINTSSGPIALVDSRITGAQGDGINSSSGAISLTRSLISGGQRDAINGSTIAVTLVNSTISGNVDRAVDASGTVNANASTIVGQGEFAFSSGLAVTLVNTIVANNNSGGANCFAPVVSSQFSIDSGTSCGLVGTGDRPSTNPLLGALANNGGPTLTHLPQPGSPAIDNGSNAACQATDQRGAARPVDGDGDGTATCDIGAVEAGAGTAPPPPPPPPPQPPAEIPTLSEWSLALLAMLLGVLALRSSRNVRRR